MYRHENISLIGILLYEVVILYIVSCPGVSSCYERWGKNPVSKYIHTYSWVLRGQITCSRLNYIFPFAAGSQSGVLLDLALPRVAPLKRSAYFQLWLILAAVPSAKKLRN